MSSLIIKLCKAVRDHLDGANYSIAFTPRRGYDVNVKLPDLEAAKEPDVLVMPAELDRALDADAATREGPADEYQVDVGVRRKLKTKTNEEIDPLVDLMEEIQRNLLGERAVGYQEAVCVEARIAPVFSPEHLDNQGIFFSVLHLRFIAIP
ncbi:MAG TPA: hypothetical protein VMY35_17365 [Phycisphaerae bacterium]|nr:hypothetical protein [Thermoguttaceae bacterium]HUX02734.1 hypothetical protein [Phycisphaerae bacterium]